MSDNMINKLTATQSFALAQSFIESGTRWLEKTVRAESQAASTVINGKAVDPWLLTATVALLAIGLTMVSSASIDYAAHQIHDPFYFAKRHLVYITMGLVIMTIAVSIPSRLWQQNAQALLLVGIALMLLVLVPGIGRRVNGSQRWIAVAGFTFQVSEFMKVALLFYLSDYFVRYEKELMGSFKSFVKPLMVLGLIVFLLLLEPDFGTAVVMTMASLGVIFVAGIPLLRFLLLMTGALLVGVLAVWFEPYRLKRLTTFTDPWAADVKFDSGYQLTQSLIAFGRGEWFGVGLGNSIQKLFYLPEAHTDFVFSIWAEEFGLLGVVLVMALFAVLLYRMIAISMVAYQQRNKFIAYVALGFSIVIGGQALINMGVASGLLPTKGLTLPFLSYGGSSLMMSCWMIGVLLRAYWELQSLGSRKQGAQV
jgi:cell division protein FtsW